MREIRPSGLEGGGADIRSPYPYLLKNSVLHPNFIAFADNRFILDLLERVPEKNVITLFGPETPALFAAPQTADTSS